MLVEWSYLRDIPRSRASPVTSTRAGFSWSGRAGYSRITAYVRPCAAPSVGGGEADSAAAAMEVAAMVVVAWEAGLEVVAREVARRAV